MLSVFKYSDNYKQEVERVWNYRDYIEELHEENSILKSTIKLLNEHYSVLDFYFIDHSSASIKYVCKEKVVEVNNIPEYENSLTFVKDNFLIIWKDNNFVKAELDIIYLYLTLLIKRVYILFVNRSIGDFSIRDTLTGLYNRRFLDDFSQMVQQQCKRDGVIYSVMMIDIDNFKSVNDNYGHLIGDEVIRKLAKVILDRVRQSDVVARYGGEEFILFLYNTDIKGAEIVAKSILNNFSNIIFSSNFTCSFSCGIDILKDGNSNISKVIENADKAMYKAKKDGKNRVSVFCH